jgi:hypothetical protein
MRIQELLKRDLSERIEEVIKLNQVDEETVYTELTEYVATDRIRGHYRTLLRSIADAPAEPHEGIGVWISGFFGSGKSSFAKNLGYLLENRPVQGHRAADLFKQQLQDVEITRLVDFITLKLPTKVVMFDVSVSTAVRLGAERMAEIMYRELLRELDYAEDYTIAELEFELEKEGQLEAFTQRCQEQYGLPWRTVRKGAQRTNRASTLLHLLDPITYPTADSWEQAATRRELDLTIGGIVSRTFELLALRQPGKALTFIIDEVGQYVAQSASKIEDLRAVVEQFGKESKNRVKQRQIIAPVWIIVTGQEKLEEVVDAIGSKRVELAKLQDRFHYRVDLAPADIREVATRRVLAKREESIPTLKQQFAAAQGQLNTACRLENSNRQSQVRESEFVQFYPYLPHFIDLSIDIMSGIRLQPGAPRHLGGSNRTIIKQAHEMLVSPRTQVASRQVGALVSLDLIYELVEGNLSSERQKDISDVAQRWKDDPQDHGWAARVAKVICLLEFVRDLPRTEANIAALLVDDLRKPVPLAEVRSALERLEAAQFIRLTPEGYKLQTAQEKRWDSERKALDARQKDRDEIKRELLEEIFKDPRYKTYRYRELRSFPIGITVDGKRMSEGLVSLVFSVADDANELQKLLDDARSDSRSKTHQDEIFWVFALTSEVHDLTRQLYASRQMISKYSQLSAQGRMIGEYSAPLESEKREEARFRDRLREKMLEALGSGQGIFRGVTKDASDLGKTPAEMFRQLFDYAVPMLFPKFEMGARTLSGKEAEEVLKAANLNALPQVLYTGEHGLHLVVKEGTKFVPNREAPVAQEVLNYLQHQQQYGEKVTGKDLELHFTQRSGYGWDLEVVRLILAVLLRAGVVEITAQGHRYRDHQDPQSRAPFTNLPIFRSATFAPRQPIDLKTLTTAARYFEEVTGQEVDVDAGAIAQAIKTLAEAELKLLLQVSAVVRTEKLPGQDALESYQKMLEDILGTDTDGCVTTLAGQGHSLKTERDQARRIREAVTEEHLALIRQARQAAEEQWPLLAADGAPSSLAGQAEELRALLGGTALYEQLARVRVLTKAIDSAYHLAYLAEHQARWSEYTQAADEIKGRHEWASIQPSGRTSILLPLTQRSCEQAELPDGAMVCQRCKTSLGLIKEHRQSLQALKQEALKRFYETLEAMNPTRPIKQVKLTLLFPDVLESEQEVEEALGRLREHLLTLVAQGARIRVE